MNRTTRSVVVGSGISRKHILCSFTEPEANAGLALNKVGEYWQEGEAEAAAAEFLHNHPNERVVILRELVLPKNQW